MSQNIPGLTVVLPLVGAALVLLIAYKSTRAARGAAIFFLALTLTSAMAGLRHVLVHGTWRYAFGDWMPPLGIEYSLDPLSGVMTVLIAGVALLVAIYALPYLREESWLRQGIFYTLFMLVASGLLGMSSTGDVFNLYVFLEISSLAAYGLIASGGPRGAVAAFRYLLIGTIAASFYLLGMGYLYMLTGTLNMADLSVLIKPMLNSTPAVIALSMIVLGLAIKMAVFPLHGWLPDAYTYSAPPVAAFISAVMTKVYAYALLRLSYFVFGVSHGPLSPILTVMGWIAVVSIIMGSVMAIAQRDFRRMLAYSSVAQIGYIVLGIAIGNVYALMGAVFHIINHGIMKCCLFLAAGGIKWNTGQHSILRFAQLSRRMPITMAAFVVAAFSMIGLPPTAGFFSKWYLALGAVEANAWPYVVVLALSSLLNLLYFFPVIENAYLRKKGGRAGAADAAAANEGEGMELPAAMLAPIIILASLILVLGLFNEKIISQILILSVPGGGF